MRKYTAILTFLAMAAGMPAFAQNPNLNPQVQVTNDYKAQLGLQGKQSVEIEVPDSLKSFRTSVDYDVIATPYKGSYEFSPYEISIAPQKPASDFGKFFFRGGAGYSFRPELQAVYVPLHKAKHTLLIYQDLSGYLGRYRSLDERSPYNGFDFSENFGLEGKVFSTNYAFDYGVDYKGLLNRDFNGNSIFHQFTVKGGIKTDIDAKVLFAANASVSHAIDTYLDQTSVRASGYFMPIWNFPFDVRVDADVAGFFYSAVYSTKFVMGISPKALIETGPLKIEAGVRLGPARDLQWLFPDVTVRADLLDGTMQPYAFAKGGQFAVDYADLKLAEHWFSPSYATDLRPGLERLNAAVGMRGNFLGKLQYDVHGGYAAYAYAPLYTYYPQGGLMAYGISQDKYSNWYVDADLAWKSRRWDADAKILYRYTSIEPNDNYLDLPQLCASARVRRNWNSRIYAGLWCEAQTARDALNYPVKGFVNLGVDAEYKIDSMLGVWAKIGNILNQDIALSPLHIENGIYFTAGISLDLR